MNIVSAWAEIKSALRVELDRLIVDFAEAHNQITRACGQYCRPHNVPLGTFSIAASKQKWVAEYANQGIGVRREKDAHSYWWSRKEDTLVAPLWAARQILEVLRGLTPEKIYHLHEQVLLDKEDLSREE